MEMNIASQINFQNIQFRETGQLCVQKRMSEDLNKKKFFINVEFLIYNLKLNSLCQQYSLRSIIEKNCF